MENRKYQRLAIDGLSGDISDGVGFFPGTITDISRFGMRMTDLPKRLDDKMQKMTVVISGRGKNFKMLVRPKWITRTGFRKMMGFQIINTPWAWTDFVMAFEPGADADVWGDVDM